MASSFDSPTPYRKTHVHFDLNTAFVTESAYSMGRTANAMFKGTGADFNNLEYTSGWGVKAYHENLDIIFERKEAQAANLLVSNGAATVAPHIEEVPLWRPPSTLELPGATTGASTQLASPNGVIGFRKSIGAGVDLSTANLIADQSAFPAPPNNDNPYGIDPTIILDRVFRSTANDSPEQNIGLYLIAYGGANNNLGYPARFYFCGPAGVNEQGNGTGQYTVIFTTNHQANVLEKCDDGTWVKRITLSTGHKVTYNSFIYLKIYKSKVCKGPNDGLGGWIKFDFASIPAERKGNSFIKDLTEIAEMQIAHSATQRYHYRVPGDGSKGATSCPLRLDLRRDISGEFFVNWFSYPTVEIFADDSPFESLDLFTATKPLVFSYNACLPNVSNVECEATLHRFDTGAELAQISRVQNVIKYTPPTDTKRFFVRVKIKSNGSVTPSFRGWNLTRDVVTAFPGVPTWEIGDATYPKSVVRSVDIRGTERDITHEGIELTIADPLSNLTVLKTRINMPMRVTTEYDPLDSSKRLSLFRGFANRATEKLMKSADGTYPKNTWGMWHVKGNGIYQTLGENFVDTPILSLIDPIDGQPLKAVNFIHKLISNTGFDYTTDFDFPDSDIRLFASDLDFTQSIDMLDKSLDVVQSLAKDFLDQILVHDDNIGTNGKWRLIDVTVPDPVTGLYTPVAGFALDGPSDPLKLIHYLPSYQGGAFPVFPIDGEKPVEFYVKPPEANWVFVASVGAWDTDSPTIYSPYPMFNPLSFDYLGVATSDPNSPDYLGRRVPVYVIDTSLMSGGDDLEQSKNAVNALQRRVYHLVAHAIKMVTFTAQLGYVVHESDPTRVRKLRYQDPIDINGTTWLVRNMNPTYVKDSVQYANYELEAPRDFFNDIQD